MTVSEEKKYKKWDNYTVVSFGPFFVLGWGEGGCGGCVSCVYVCVWEEKRRVGGGIYVLNPSASAFQGTEIVGSIN